MGGKGKCPNSAVTRDSVFWLGGLGSCGPRGIQPSAFPAEQVGNSIDISTLPALNAVNSFPWINLWQTLDTRGTSLYAGHLHR